MPILQGAPGYVRGLGVRVSASAPLVLRFDGEHTQDWEALDAGSECQGLLSYYVDVFDFRSDEEMLDLAYVKAVAHRNHGPISEGALLAFRRSEVDLVDLTRGSTGETK